MADEIYTLPEDCLSNVISLTSPKDACRLSAVVSTFQSAAQSDVVWERFLPSDYRELICGSTDGTDSLLARFKSKKELYMYLSNHAVFIESGRKTFSLEKSSGKKCYMMTARDLYIEWGGTPQYWQWISLPQSRFSEVAELLDVCWLEIEGMISTKMLSSGTNYAAYLVFTCNSEMCGFNIHAATGSVRIDGHEETEKRFVCLDPNGLRRPENLRYDDHGRNIEFPKKRNDGWMEVEFGELFMKGEEEGDLEMTLMEIKGGNWKTGLIIEGIEIRPKEC